MIQRKTKIVKLVRREPVVIKVPKNQPLKESNMTMTECTKNVQFGLSGVLYGLAESRLHHKLNKERRQLWNGRLPLLMRLLRVTLDCQKRKPCSKSIFLEEQVAATQLLLDGRKFSRGRNLLKL